MYEYSKNLNVHSCKGNLMESNNAFTAAGKTEECHLYFKKEKKGRH